MNVAVRDNQNDDRYEIHVDGQLAGFAEYRLRPGKISFPHTEIEPKQAGAGLGSQLIRFALDDARSRGLSIVPLCPFVIDYIRRHPDDYLDLVVPAMRNQVIGES
ncbi:MAG: GNAT family N-acetyltransferase [Solirubrobacterales bacterium]